MNALLIAAVYTLGAVITGRLVAHSPESRDAADLVTWKALPDHLTADTALRIQDRRSRRLVKDMAIVAAAVWPATAIAVGVSSIVYRIKDRDRSTT